MAVPYEKINQNSESSDAVASLAQLPRIRIVVSVLGTLLAVLLAAIDQTIVATALPRVVADLGGFDQFAWVFTSYMLASTISIPIMGKLSDVYGRKWVLVVGVLIFLVGSALCGNAQNMIQLILFRGIQGLGAGSIIANAYAVMGDVFPPAQRGKWAGVVGAVFALAFILGPLAGGYVTDHFSWRLIFFANLPIGFVAFVVILLGMADVGRPRARPSIDYLGVATLVAAVVPLLLALTWAGKEFPWSSPEVVGLLLVAGVMAVLFLAVERRASEPIIPGFLFVNPIFSVAMAVTFLTAIVMFGGIMFIPLFIQGVIGSSATNAGLTLMPALLSVVVSAIVAGQFISRTGHYRFVAIGGMCTMAAGVYLFTRLDAHSSSADAARAMVLAGAGLGATVPTFMISVQNAFDHNMLGVVSASVQFFRTIGGAVGTAVLGSIMTIRLGDKLGDFFPTKGVDSLPPQVVEQLKDPQTLMDPGAMARIREIAEQGEGGAAALNTVIEGLRTALAGAMHEVFLLALGITLLAVVVSLFFREIPLRNTMAETGRKLDMSNPD